MESQKLNGKSIKIGFLGLGTMGFSVVHGLVKSGYSVILPTYRRKEDIQIGFSQLAPTPEDKDRLYEEMLEQGAEGADKQEDLISRSDVIMTMMPNSRIVELLMYGNEGILENAKQGSLVIDLTSADAGSTQKLAKELEERGVDMLDAPVSGGNEGATAQTLAIMVGGKKEVFERYLSIFHTMGNPEKVMYIGPHGAGDIIKCCNNYLSCLCLVATTEALTVAAKNGIDPHTANAVISSSGGRSDATLHKFPDIAFLGRDFHGTLGMMLKDMGLFTQAAKEKQVPTLMANTIYQFWNMCHNKYGAAGDMGNVIREFEQWCDVKLYGIDEER